MRSDWPPVDPRDRQADRTASSAVSETGFGRPGGRRRDQGRPLQAQGGVPAGIMGFPEDSAFFAKKKKKSTDRSLY